MVAFSLWLVKAISMRSRNGIGRYELNPRPSCAVVSIEWYATGRPWGSPKKSSTGVEMLGSSRPS